MTQSPTPNMHHTWVRAGQPLGAIVISPAASEAERFAAQELARYLHQISGATLPIHTGIRQRPSPAIVILDVARPVHRELARDLPLDQLRDDGYLLHTVGPDLFIVSNDPFGVVFGVYQFLSRILGVRFHDFAPAGEDVPTQPTIAHAALALLKNPRLRYRGTQLAYDPRRLDWMAKNGFNYTRIGASPQPLDWWDAPLARMIPELRKRGIRISFGHHLFHALLPLETYRADAPELFLQKAGQPVRAEQFHWSLTNPTALAEVIYNIETFLARHPEIAMLDFWPADGIHNLSDAEYHAVTGAPTQQHGEWEKHVAGSGGALTARLGNPNKARVYAEITRRVATAIAHKFPQVQVSITAYADLVQPAPDVALPANVVPFIALYWRCRRHHLCDDACIFNRQFKQAITEWTALFREDVRGQGPDVCLSEYYSAMNAYLGLPYPCLTHLFDEWRALTEMGITGAKIHTGRDADTHSAAYHINYLAFAEFVWGDAPNLDSFLHNYCRDFFGPAAEPIRQLYLRLEAAVQNAVHTQPAFISLAVPSLDHIFTAEVLTDCVRLLDEARRAAANPKTAQRVRRLTLLLDYTRAAMPLAAPLWQRARLKKQGESTAALDAQLLPDVTAIVQQIHTLRALDLDILGFERPSPFFPDVPGSDAPSHKPHRWEKILADLQKQPPPTPDFNPDILDRPTPITPVNPIHPHH